MSLDTLSDVDAGAYVVPIRSAPREDFDDLGEYGRLRGGSPVILIHEDIRGPFREAIVGHEIVHAWLHAYGIDRDLPPGVEERICYSISHELARLLRRLS